MFYTWNITLPINGSEAAHIKERLRLGQGTITRFELVFPVGCANLVYVYISDGAYQVYPKEMVVGIPALDPTRQDRFIGDGVTIVSTDEYEIKEPPLELDFHGWNTDEIYPHKITVRIQLVPAREILTKVVSQVMRITKLRRPE